MKKDYLPQGDATVVAWLTNFKTKIGTLGASLGLTPAEITALQNQCTMWIANINAVNAKRTELSASLQTRDTQGTEAGSEIRDSVRKIKSSSSYTDSIGEELGIIAGDTSLDLASFKATISAERFAGHIRIKFVKGATDGINLYHRKKGQSEWKFLARDTKSPYDDHIELEVAGQPEHWEYRAFGVVDDAEIGSPSDIVEMVFGI